MRSLRRVRLPPSTCASIQWRLHLLFTIALHARTPLLNSSLDPASDGFTCQAEAHTSRHGRTIRAALYRPGREACACARSDELDRLCRLCVHSVASPLTLHQMASLVRPRPMCLATEGQSVLPCTVQGREACACARSAAFNVSVDFCSMRRHLYLLHLLCTPLLKKQPRSRVTNSAPLLGKQLTTS